MENNQLFNPFLHFYIIISKFYLEIKLSTLLWAQLHPFKLLEKRLPKGGAFVKAYSYGHILHQVYRGLIVSDLNLTTDTLELFVADNETAKEENEVQEHALNQGVIEIDIDDEENYIFATFKQSQQQQTQAPSQSLLTPQTPLQA